MTLEQQFYLSDSINLKKRFFGRRKAKALTSLQETLYEKAKDELFFEVEAVRDIPLLFDNDNQKTILEIGFGGGEHLCHQALCNPDINYIGVDAYVNGVSKLVRSIYKNNIHNIRLSDGDAFHLLNLIPENSLDGVYLLYPDPWPKKRHRNRRFIQRDTAILIEKILKPNGFFRFASDISEYVEWVFASITNATTGYIDIHKLPNTPFENWIPTRYEQKAIREGRESVYYEFRFSKNNL
jgi:tRNA (guanine-N7-)-methyltransferase